MTSGWDVVQLRYYDCCEYNIPQFLINWYKLLTFNAAISGTTPSHKQLSCCSSNHSHCHAYASHLQTTQH